MKKAIFAALLVMLFGTMVHAETKTGQSTPKAKSLSSIIERTSGKIESVKKANPAQGDFGAVSLFDADGKKKDFALIAKTRIFSDNSGPLTLEQLKKGDQVTVLYVVTLKGINEAIAVTQTR